MKKPHGRQTKKKVGRILAEHHRKTAMHQLEQIPDAQLVGHLFTYLYHMDPKIKFRSITAMGCLVARMAEHKMESARNVLRRIIWNLNDESGGIGWGSAEAMGEILSLNPSLADEFSSILLSYLDPRANFIEHEGLQQGILWGIGTLAGQFPDRLTPETRTLLYGYLRSVDPIKRGYAVRALIQAAAFDCRLVPEAIFTDQEQIEIFTGWHFVSTRISDMALACESAEKTV